MEPLGTDDGTVLFLALLLCALLKEAYAVEEPVVYLLLVKWVFDAEGCHPGVWVYGEGELFISLREEPVSLVGVSDKGVLLGALRAGSETSWGASMCGSEIESGTSPR